MAFNLNLTPRCAAHVFLIESTLFRIQEAILRRDWVPAVEGCHAIEEFAHQLANAIIASTDEPKRGA